MIYWPWGQYIGGSKYRLTPACIRAHAWRTCCDACRDRKLAVSFEVCGGENVPSIPGACATCNFTYLVWGPWPSYVVSPGNIWTNINHDRSLFFSVTTEFDWYFCVAYMDVAAYLAPHPCWFHIISICGGPSIFKWTCVVIYWGSLRGNEAVSWHGWKSIWRLWMCMLYILLCMAFLTHQTQLSCIQ